MRILSSPEPPPYSLSVTNEIVIGAAVPEAGAARGLEVELVAENVRIEDDRRELVAAETLQAREGAVALTAAEQLEDAHLGRRIPLERVDGTEVRGVRNRDLVPMRAGQREPASS